MRIEIELSVKNYNAMRNYNENLKIDKSSEMNTDFSFHSKKRAQQRGIASDLIYLAMDYSAAIFKQGLIFYVVMEKLLPEKMEHELKEKLNNMVIVVSLDSNEVITCYKRQGAVHYINKKSKRLAA